MKTKKAQAIIFGTNERIWWDNILEAIIWSKLYNAKHWILRDGKCITTIFTEKGNICV